MENYAWVIPLCILIVMLGLMFLLLWSTVKVRWLVILKDNTRFIGERTLGAMWQEGFLESAYKVIDSLDSCFSEGMIVNLGWGTRLYRIKIK